MTIYTIVLKLPRNVFQIIHKLKTPISILVL